MKVSEFEEKLTTVSDAKLLQMLSAGRRDGPDIAVKLILAEGHRRGLEGLGPENLEEDYGKGIKAYPNPKRLGVENEEVLDADAPAGAANWLSEETSPSKVAPAIKVALYIAALGGLVFGALKFIHRG